MLSVGLTGGIAAGKSTVAGHLARLGAIVVDADQLARDVVAPGSEGLAEIVREFGVDVLGADGALDRAALGAVVFEDPAKRRVLELITHPRIHEEHVRREAAAVAADPAAVVVHDVPLIVENDIAHRYHLVLVVDAPAETRIERMVRDRGMTEDAARARISAQATRAERLAVADEWLENSGTESDLLAQVERIWRERVVVLEENLRAGRAAPTRGAELADPTETVPDGRRRDEAWADQGARLVRRAAHVLGAAGIAADVSHVGSTAVRDLAARDVIDLQVGVDALDVGALAPALREAGFVADEPGEGTPGVPPVDESPAALLSADPGRPAEVRMRVTGSEPWRNAIALRDALRADPAARYVYALHKGRPSSAHAGRPGGTWFDVRGNDIAREHAEQHDVVADVDTRDEAST
ncbi:Dephospho-CoA kinase [Actinomycetales bacterium JB111]|nr:Dephospho-CoA kinase [Actinomycetales bacterium JB111]